MTESRPLAGHATDPQCGPRDGAACRGLSASSIPGRGELTHRGPIFRSAVTIRGESPPERVNLLAEPAAIFMCRRGFDGGAARGGSLRRSWALLRLPIRLFHDQPNRARDRQLRASFGPVTTRPEPFPAPRVCGRRRPRTKLLRRRRHNRPGQRLADRQPLAKHYSLPPGGNSRW